MTGAAEKIQFFLSTDVAAVFAGQVLQRVNNFLYVVLYQVLGARERVGVKAGDFLWRRSRTAGCDRGGAIGQDPCAHPRPGPPHSIPGNYRHLLVRA